MKKKGVYGILNVIENIVYVGSSRDINKRTYRHRSELKANSHFNTNLQEAWNRLGEAKFITFIIEEIEDDGERLEYERKYIKENKYRVYNIDLPSTPTKKLIQSSRSLEALKRGERQKKEVILENDVVCHIFDSVSNAARFLEVKRQRIQELINGYKIVGKDKRKLVHQVKGYRGYIKGEIAVDVVREYFTSLESLEKFNIEK